MKAILSCCYLFSSSIFALMNYVGFATWVGSDYHSPKIFSQLSIGLAVFCLPYLRWKHPEWERPIKVRFIFVSLKSRFCQVNLIFPTIYIICSILVTLVPMMASPKETGE